MTIHVVFLLLGLGGGAVFAALALGLVMTHRSSGVVNFATGAMALYGAYSYSYLRHGELLVPLPGLPDSIELGGELPFAAAFAGAIALSALLAAVLYALVFRQLRNAPGVAKAVASLGVMVALQAIFVVKLGTNPVPVEPILPRSTFVIGDVRVPGDRLWFAGVILVVGLSLSVVLRVTRFGVATRAVAETEKGALLTGLSPDRIALTNWALSGAIAGLGGILIAPIVPLVPFSYTLFIVPALAAALAANFESVAITVAAALGIGVVQSELSYLQTQYEWLPQHGLADVVPLALIMMFLVVRGRPLPPRGAVVTRQLGGAPRPRVVWPPATLAAVAGLGLLLLTDGSYRSSLITSMILAIVALSLVVVTGYAGQVSLAQLSLAGVGAFLLSRLTIAASIPFPLAPLLAAAGAAVVGVVVGLPALRIRGLPVAVVTLALAVAVEAIWFRNPDLTGGVQGSTVKSPSIFGLDLGIGSGTDYPRVAFGVVCLVSLLSVGVAVALLRRSRLGAAMLAIRANERSAAATGIDVSRTKVLAFAIASFIAGLGGALLAYQQTLASPDTYAALAGLGFFATVYIAGITTVTGGVLAGVIANGGIVYLLLSRAVPSIGGWYEVITGCVLVLQVIRFPEGAVVGIHRRIDGRRSRDRSRADQAAAHVQPEVAGASPPGMRRPESGRTLLRLDGVDVRYGASRAVQEVSLEVPERSIVGLIGPNGAGKTTLIDAISGFAGYRGEVRFNDVTIDGLAPHERVRAGLGRTFQGIELWDDLSVMENIGVGSALAPARRRRRVSGDHASVNDVHSLLKVDSLGHRSVRELSQGQRQLVSIARSLACCPRLLLLDEPAGGLDSSESEWLADRLRDIRAAGVTVLLVDHDMNLVLGVCDWVYVLDLGVVIAAGTPDEIRNDPRVMEAYLGTAPTAAEVATCAPR